MKTIYRFISIILVISCIFFLVSCKNKKDKNNVSESDNQNSSNASISEENFEWEDNIIIGLTDRGAKQKSLVIPKRCEGFNGPIFTGEGNVVTEVSFESNNDVILNGVFRSASKVEEISLPKDLTIISDLEFWFCSNLKSISIPANVTEVGEYAFQENQALKTVDFEGDTTTIKAHAFDGCTSLESISFPSSVSLIEEYAFYGCTSLKEIKLPEGINIIEGFAFANSGLSDLYIPLAVELGSYDTTSFVQADHTVKVYVVSDSWSDVNFDEVFTGAFEKNYFE